MVDLNYKIRIIFSILSMILSVHGWEINILNVLTDIKCKAHFKFDEQFQYTGTYLEPINYEPLYPNSAVIVHIVDENRFEDFANINAASKRASFAEKLKKIKYEVIILGYNFSNCPIELFKSFLSDLLGNISRQRIRLISPSNFGFTGAENLKNHEFLINGLTHDFPRIEDKSERTDPRQMKYVKFYDFSNPNAKDYKEVIWPVHLKDGVYDPQNPISYTKADNFLLRYSDSYTFQIVIVSGKEYELIQNRQTIIRNQFNIVTKEMKDSKHILCIMGCFNFEWSDIELVPQIILKHSQILDPKTRYKVFTVGSGMFESRFRNPYSNDARQLVPTTQEIVKQFAKMCKLEACNSHGIEPKGPKTLKIWDMKRESGAMDLQFTLSNGQYEPPRTNRFHLPQDSNKNFVFFVVDSSEMFTRRIYEDGAQGLLASLEREGILAYLIIASNFEYYDLHIISEWVECHRVPTNPNRITILGSGKFDTTYQYLLPLYQVFYTPSFFRNEYGQLQQVIAETHKKAVFIYKINSAKPERNYRKYPMHTINGIYDPVVLSADNIETRNEAKILFIIIEPLKFQAATNEPCQHKFVFAAIEQAVRETLVFWDDWIIYLTCLENFKEYDSHLFAEFVKVHTNDKRPFCDFVYVLNDSSDEPKYKYKDEKLFTPATNQELKNDIYRLIMQMN